VDIKEQYEIGKETNPIMFYGNLFGAILFPDLKLTNTIKSDKKFNRMNDQSFNIGPSKGSLTYSYVNNCKKHCSFNGGKDRYGLTNGIHLLHCILVTDYWTLRKHVSIDRITTRRKSLHHVEMYGGDKIDLNTWGKVDLLNHRELVVNNGKRNSERLKYCWLLIVSKKFYDYLDTTDRFKKLFNLPDNLQVEVSDTVLRHTYNIKELYDCKPKKCDRYLEELSKPYQPKSI
jgi:hypothetical protein